MSEVGIIVERIVHPDPHMNGKVVILRGRWAQVSLDQVQQHPTTIMHTVMASALVSNLTTLEREREHVRKTVAEYVANFQAIEKALGEL